MGWLNHKMALFLRWRHSRKWVHPALLPFAWFAASAPFISPLGRISIVMVSSCWLLYRNARLAIAAHSSQMGKKCRVDVARLGAFNASACSDASVRPTPDPSRHMLVVIYDCFFIFSNFRLKFSLVLGRPRYQLAASRFPLCRPLYLSDRFPVDIFFSASD